MNPAASGQAGKGWRRRVYRIDKMSDIALRRFPFVCSQNVPLGLCCCMDLLRIQYLRDVATFAG